MLNELLEKIWHIWTLGGWTMIPLALLCLLIYGTAVGLLTQVSRRDYRRVPQETWTGWVHEPVRAKGEIGEIIRYTQDEARSLSDVHNRFEEVSLETIHPLNRRLVVLNTLIAAAPLMGLLGTVWGMLVTFQALAIGGGELTEMMSSGISQALFPPEVGLCIALPGLAMVQLIKRRCQEYEAFLARLESVTIQRFRHVLARGELEKVVAVRESGSVPLEFHPVLSAATT